MGYALFAHRKISLTNQIFTLQQKIDAIAQQKISLLEFSASIADGMVTIEEIASDPSNLNNYMHFLQANEEYKSRADEDGGCNDTINYIVDISTDQGLSDEEIQALLAMTNQAVNEKFAAGYNKQLEAQENKLDMQQKKLETKLSALQKQLDSVEQAEATAIEKATPKYNGVG